MPSPSARGRPTDSSSTIRLSLAHLSRTPSQAPQIASDITRAAMEDFRQLFDMFDKNRDQEIDSTEFAEIIQMLGDECPSSQDLEHMIRVACETSPQHPPPSSLTFSQFMRFFAIYKQDWPTKVTDADVFNVLDEDRGGTITPQELCKVLNRFGMRVTDDEANAMADFATPLAGPNEIAAADMAEVATRVRHLRERKGVSVHTFENDDDHHHAHRHD